MPEFKDIFGITRSQLRKTCLLVPVLTKDLLKKLDIQDFKRSNFYACGSNEHTTVIHTLMGPSFVGDAVLHLSESPCANLILFGSCGLVQTTPQLNLGSLVTPYESYAMESFSDLLSEEPRDFNSSAADNDFLNKFLYCLRKEEIQAVKCASFGSIALESKHRDYLLKENIQVMDMESAAFFFAAKHTAKKAVALFYVTDIMADQPAFKPLAEKDKQKVLHSRSHAIDLLVQFTDYLAAN